jgi:hypothetical protein
MDTEHDHKISVEDRKENKDKIVHILIILFNTIEYN